MVIHEKHPNVLQYKESKHNIFYQMAWTAYHHFFAQVGHFTELLHFFTKKLKPLMWAQLKLVFTLY